MSVGQGNILVQQRKQAGGGPPFPIGAANNGLSVDAVSGDIVLGGDFTGVAGPEQLLSQRQIWMNGFQLTLLDANGETDINTSVLSMGDNAGNFSTTQSVGGSALFSATSIVPGNPANFNLGTGTLSEQVFLRNNAGVFEITYENLSPGSELFHIDPVTGLYQLGDISGITNGTRFSIDDAAGVFSIENTALTASVTINGTPGFTGTVTPVTSITVIGGIVTSVS